MGRHAAFFVTLAVAVLAGACSSEDGSDAAPTVTVDEGGVMGAIELCLGESMPEPELLEVGVVTELPDEGRDHVFCPTYDQRPPASGDHFDAWQNCGFYTAPVQDQTAVHALEHGAVWIAYSPDLPSDEIAAIEARVAGQSHLLAAPYPGLQNPIVMTAWTRQLALDRVGDPMFEEFIDTYEARKSPTAPEAGASCGGQIGSPPADPNAAFEEIVAQVLG
ncbi:MAG: DUF3105 domain-containing protein [Acidimicrobiales bacterium]